MIPFLTNLKDEQTNKSNQIISSGVILISAKDIHPGYAQALISIRVSNPGIMLWTWASAGVKVVRIVREATDVWGATRRGWGRGVAFPWSEIFDFIEAGR